MRQLTHHIVFTSLFFTGLVLFVTAFVYQFGIVPMFITQELVRWIAPFGLGFIIIGGTGMYITSRRHQMKKLKDVGPIEGVEDEGEEGQGQRFHDYITSPEEGTTVYTLFLAGTVVIVWGIIMLFQWIRFLFR